MKNSKPYLIIEQLFREKIRTTSQINKKPAVVRYWLNLLSAKVSLIKKGKNFFLPLKIISTKIIFPLFKRLNRFADNNNRKSGFLQGGIYFRRVIGDKTIDVSDFRRQKRLQ